MSQETDPFQLLELQLIKTSTLQTHVDSTLHTYPRLRRPRKMLNTCLDNAEAGGQILGSNQVLAKINTRWNFNAFSFDRLTSGQNLATLCTYLFRDLGLISHFKLDALVVWRFFAAVERHYHTANPYHNGVHAADVTQAMACFIHEPIFRQNLTFVEKMAAIIAAVGHDLDHPGLNEKFLISTSSHLAGLYNNTSVLENHHWRTCVALMHETGFASALDTPVKSQCEQLIQAMVLATDISRQGDFLTQLGQFLDTQSMDMSQSLYRHFMLQIALKCADISNPCRTWNISRLWSYRACEEFYRQGDRERELNIPVTPLFDRNCISVAKVQSTFYRNMAAPLFEEWHRAVNSPLSSKMLNNLSSNQARWDLICQQEALMAESIVSTSSSSGTSKSRRGSLGSNPPAISVQRQYFGSSGEEDQSEGDYPYLPLGENSPRRHSLSDCFHRQLQLQELRKQNSDLLASLKVAKRRRIFARMNSNHKAASAEDPKFKAVTFNLSLDSRRGSAPCTLLLNQINKIATSASKAVTVTRRSSLPGSERDPESYESRKKQRKLLRRKSAGAGDNYPGASKKIHWLPFKSNGNSMAHRWAKKNQYNGRRGSLPLELILC